MPPFQYTPFVDPYVGSIAQLMGQRGQREADAAEQIAAIRAQEAIQRGQISGGVIQGIGNLAGSTIRELTSPEARRQRELDKAHRLYREGLEEVRQVDDPRYRTGDPRLQTGSIGSTIQHLQPSVTTAFGDAAPTEAELDAMQSGQIRLPNQSFSYSQGRPDITTGSRDTQIVAGEPYIETLTREIKGFLTDDGFFDPRRAMAKMSEGGISPSVMNEVMRDVHGNNEMLAAWDALETKNEEDKTVLFGRLAATAIKQSESGVLPITSAIALNLEPLELRFGKEAINDLRVRLIGLSPDQQKATLTDAVKAADDILGYDVFTQGQGQVSKITGEAAFPAGIDPVTEAQTAVLEATRSGDPDKITSAVDALVNVSNPMSSFQIEMLEAELGLKRGTLAEAIEARKEQAALAARTQGEIERTNRKNEELIQDENLRRYPAPLTSSLVFDDQNLINIDESMRALRLPITPKDEKLFSRANWTTTGAFSFLARYVGPLTGLSEESMANITAIEIGEAIVVRALAENENLAERERTAIAKALDMATAIGQSPITVRAKFREIDAVLRRALYRKDEIDDVKAILQAVDVLGVPQSDEAPAGTVLLYRNGESFEIPTGSVAEALADGFSRTPG